MSCAPSSPESKKKDAGNTNAETNYLAKYKVYKYYETLVELLTKQYEIAKVDENRECAVIQVLDAAEPPLSASLGVGLALLLIVFIRHGIHTATQNPEKANQMQKLCSAINRALSHNTDLG
jgi:hypothetical protein